MGYNALSDQLKIYSGSFNANEIFIRTLPADFSVSLNPKLEPFMNDKILKLVQLFQLSQETLDIPIDLHRKTFEMPNQTA